MGSGRPPGQRRATSHGRARRTTLRTDEARRASSRPAVARPPPAVDRPM